MSISSDKPEPERLVKVHPQRIKAIASARLNNDKVDSATLAQQTLLLTRLRTTCGQQRARAKNQLQAVLHQEGFLKPVADGFGKRGRAWLEGWG